MTRRVLIVDDSAVTRSMLRLVLEPHPEIEVAGLAASGDEALAAFDLCRPDLVLLDIEMPGMNGLDALSALRRRAPRLPVIMCSTLTERGARITIEALTRGATDYVTKPTSQTGIRQSVETLTRELLPKIHALFPSESLPPAQPPIPLAKSASFAPPRLIVIGVSTGGPAALEAMLPKFSASFPLPILIVQHMPRLFTGMLAERLNSLCALRVREATPGSSPQPGVVDLARGDWHMELGRDFRIRLHQTEPEHFCRPSVNILFRSAAAACGGRLLAVVLTGIGSDGLAGCRVVRESGGAVFVQDKASSVIWGMPGAVAAAGLADKVLPLDALASEIQRCAAQRLGAPEMAVS